MASNKTTVSIYPDGDLLEALRDFQSQGNYKSLNVAAIAILREKLLGDVSSTLESKVSSTLDIQSMIDVALESLRSEHDAMIDNAIATKLDPIVDGLKLSKQLIDEVLLNAKKPLMLPSNVVAMASAEVLKVRA